MVHAVLVVLLLQVMLNLWLASLAFAEAFGWLQNGDGLSNCKAAAAAAGQKDVVLSVQKNCTRGCACVVVVKRCLGSIGQDVDLRTWHDRSSSYRCSHKPDGRQICCYLCCLDERILQWLSCSRGCSDIDEEGRQGQWIVPVLQYC